MLAMLILVATPCVRHRSPTLLFFATWQVALGGLFPLFGFLASCANGPAWKGESPDGWIGCFEVGKIVLLPLVCWALASIYALELWRVEDRTRSWLILGCSQGVVLSGYFCLWMLAWMGQWPSVLRASRPAEILLGLAILMLPFLACGYFFHHTRQLWREGSMRKSRFWLGQLWGLPFWLGSIYNARRIYSELPEEPPPGCFVVTAAAHGHPILVGPFVPIERGGLVRRANIQLLTFWELERCWTVRLPRSHQAFRRVYNPVGRKLARFIARPWLADAAYLALKPAEWLAALTLKLTSYKL